MGEILEKEREMSDSTDVDRWNMPIVSCMKLYFWQEVYIAFIVVCEISLCLGMSETMSDILHNAAFSTKCH